MSLRNVDELNNMVGKKFGKLTVIEVLPTKQFPDKRRPIYRSMIKCKCDCGNERELTVKQIKSGHTRSCGCYVGDKNRKYFTTHGMRQHPLYIVWCSMRSRCYNPNEVYYKNYGGRGIRVCSEWCKDAGAFIEWSLKNGWEKGLDIDRFNNNGNYEPSNCRYVNRTVNCNNRRNSKLYLYKGEEKTLSEWCKELNLIYNTVRGRIIRGADFKKAVETPRVKYCKGGLIVLFLLTFSISSYCQMVAVKTFDKVEIKQYLPSLSLTFLSGMADGVRDCSIFYHIKNGGYFDGRESWRNKYRNGDYQQGPAYFGSTSFLAWTTDGAHLMSTVGHTADAWAFVMKPNTNDRRFGKLLLEATIMMAARSAGHFLMYDVLIKNGNRQIR